MIKSPEETAFIAETKEVVSWASALLSLEQSEQKTFIIQKAMQGRMTHSVAERLIRLLGLEGV
jgi:hypothetical protein